MKHSKTTTATDAELLDRYEMGRDQHAFAEVVRRHRPMVLATTRRVVGCRADADDACQAAFLTLARTVDKLSNKNCRGELASSDGLSVCDRDSENELTMARKDGPHETSDRANS